MKSELSLSIFFKRNAKHTLITYFRKAVDYEGAVPHGDFIAPLFVAALKTG